MEKQPRMYCLSTRILLLRLRGFLQATFLAMERALRALPCQPDIALIDGNRSRDFGLKTQTVVHGDSLSASIAAASILAKVTRDDYMMKMAETYPGSDRVPGVGSARDADYAERVRALQEAAGRAMNDFLLPLYQGDAFEPGSTDVGDVSWQCPTAQIHVATWPNGCPGHSWQNVSCGATELGHKAAIHAGKVLAGAAIDLLTTPSLLEEARAEFRRRTTAGYTCPIPPDAVPTIAD